ncbi:hypothetical protein K466DRAFT_564668 [Polyporus arcularius HHB13444]|uniref:Uncharacterized protein n=1 Tax=Polyporus arcularius HHB13444 TaxID=1314778 RepID=A0A5C3PFT6_9APHY|nr:hypothetical protein K466DRAFT_564668 [Polyporus arcularius HHB13444]
MVFIAIIPTDSNQLLQRSFEDSTNPSLGSYVHTSNTSPTTPDLAEFPRPICESPGAGGKHVPVSAVTSLQAPSPGTSPQSQAVSSASPANETSTSSSSDEQLPTRASIRAWAKATPAGPPRNSPSPWGSAVLPQSKSDDTLDRHSITRSAGQQTDGASGSGSGTSSSDEDGRGHPRDLPFSEESSGNVADIDSSGSSGEDMAPQDTSDPSRPHRDLLAPAALHPHPQPHQSQAHPGSSSSESPPPARVVPPAGIQEQQERIDRRVDRHHTGAGRRRHRDRERERRARPSNPTPTPPHHQSQPQPQARPHGHSTLAPLRLIPDRPLPPPPPPPLRPLRPLQVATSSSGGGDLFDDISRMLQFSRRPLLRTGVDPGGTREAFSSPSRNNDVLTDIWFMIQMSNGR